MFNKESMFYDKALIYVSTIIMITNPCKNQTNQS